MAFERILCGIDFSEASVAAFRQAVELARLNDSQLYALHTIEAQPFVANLNGVGEMGETAVKLEEEATAALDSFITSSVSALALEAISLTTEVTTGRAFAEILSHARDWSADLIVLGDKDPASIEQVVVGSTAERVMKDAPCSVLIVRQYLAQEPAQKPGAKPEPKKDAARS